MLLVPREGCDDTHAHTPTFLPACPSERQFKDTAGYGVGLPLVSSSTVVDAQKSNTGGKEGVGWEEVEEYEEGGWEEEEEEGGWGWGVGRRGVHTIVSAQQPERKINGKMP